MSTEEIELSRFDYEEFFMLAFEYLKNIPQTWKKPKIFIDGESDSFQTKFESLSNQGKIGVLAHSKTEGYILLLFLRCIIDDNYEIIEDILSDECDKNTIPLDEAIKILASYETTYTGYYDKGTTIRLEMTDDTSIIVNEGDIDLWDCDRIRAHISKRYGN